MATQLALQRNFVTITPANQISTSSTVQSNQTTMTTSPTTHGEIVSITTTGNQSTQSDSNGVHLVATHTQVNSTPTYLIDAFPYQLNSNAVFIVAEKIYSSGRHNVRWSFNYWCGAHRSVRFNRRCTNHRVDHNADEFGRIVAKQFQFTANNRSSGFRPSARHSWFNIIGNETAFHNGQWYVELHFIRTFIVSSGIFPTIDPRSVDDSREKNLLKNEFE